MTSSRSSYSTFSTKGWGYNLFFPGEMGLGLLPEDFEGPGLHVWDLAGEVGHFVDGIEVPLDPFSGIAGVCPAGADGIDTLPPRSVGGNIDIKHLTAGSTLFLPVEEEGALFSTSDCHVAQGDGEVCVTDIGAPLFLTACFDVREDMDIEQPQFRTDGPFTPTGVDEPMYGTTGIDEDLMEATKKAIRHMITHPHEERGLARGGLRTLFGDRRSEDQPGGRRAELDGFGLSAREHLPSVSQGSSERNHRGASLTRRARGRYGNH